VDQVDQVNQVDAEKLGKQYEYKYQGDFLSFTFSFHGFLFMAHFMADGRHCLDSNNNERKRL
jgi:hypothetical protein